MFTITYLHMLSHIRIYSLYTYIYMIHAHMHACIPTYLHPYIPTLHTYIRIYVPLCWRLVSLFSKTAILKKACKQEYKTNMQKQMQVQKHTAKKCKSQIKKHAGAKAQFAFCSHLSCILPRFLHVFFDIMFVQLVPGLICFFLALFLNFLFLLLSQ